MASRAFWLAWSPAFIAGSSVLGLLSIGTGYPELFLVMWQASLWADLIFCIGTVGALWATIELARQKGPWAAAFLMLGLTWLVYTLSFMFAANGLFIDITFTWFLPTDITFRAVGNFVGVAPSGNFGAAGGVLQVGWPGLLASGIAGFFVARDVTATERAARSRATRTPPVPSRPSVRQPVGRPTPVRQPAPARTVASMPTASRGLPAARPSAVPQRPGPSVAPAAGQRYPNAPTRAASVPVRRAP